MTPTSPIIPLAEPLRYGGAITLIIHRRREDGLVGDVLSQEPCGVLPFPAIAEDDQTHEGAAQSRCVTRRRGEALLWAP